MNLLIPQRVAISYTFELTAPKGVYLPRRELLKDGSRKIHTSVIIIENFFQKPLYVSGEFIQGLVIFVHDQPSIPFS